MIEIRVGFFDPIRIRYDHNPSLRLPRKFYTISDIEIYLINLPVVSFKKILKNTSLLFVGQVITQFLSMLVGILIARNLGKSTFGNYSLAFVFVGIFSIFFSFGTDPIIVRMSAQSHDQKRLIVSSNLWIRLTGYPFTLGLVLLAGFLFGYTPNQRTIFFLTAIAMGLSSLGDLPRYIFQGMQRMELDTYTRITEKILAFIIVWICLRFSSNLNYAIGGLIISAFIGSLVGWIILKWLVNFHIEFNFHDILAMIKQAAPLTGSFILVGIYMRLPQVILSFYRPVAEVGLYTVAYSIMLPFTFFSLAFSGAFLPVLSNMFDSSPQQVNKLHESLIAYSLMFGLPSAACLGLFSKNIIQFLYGYNYLPASPALTILSLNVILFFLGMNIYNLIIANGRQKVLIKVTFINLVTTFFFTLLLTPKFGLIGTAISVVLIEGISLVIKMYFTAHLVKHRLNRKAISAFLATGFMLIGGVAAGTFSFWLRAPLSLAIYGIGLWITGGVTLNDFRTMSAYIDIFTRKGKLQ